MLLEPKMPREKRWPGESDEAHPGIFNTMPPQPTEEKSGQLPEKDIRQFFELGYVAVESFFKHEELDACRRAIDRQVDELADIMVKAGKLSQPYNEYGLFERLTVMEKEFPGTNVLLHKTGSLSQAFCDLWTNERLLNSIEQLIGPDIMGHPVWNLRPKTPQTETGNVPWHQDIAYLDNDSYSVLQPTAWIPLVDADETNGCLQIAERGHKTGKVAQHQCCAGDTWYVMLDPKEMEKTLEVDLEKDLKTVPVKYGGMVLFNNMIPHRSLPNLSKGIRWSLDLRWQSPDKPVGFHGLRQGILFRSSKDPNIKIDWTPAEAIKVSGEFNFDTTVAGPWMAKWEMTHTNRHTDAFVSGSTSWHTE